MNRPLRLALLGLALVLLPSVLAAPATAQIAGDQVQRMLESTSEQEIVAQLRASGLTRAQVRTRLTASGYPANLLDRYFDAIEAEGNGTELLQDVDPDVVQAMRDVGVTLREGAPDAQVARVEAPESPSEPQLFGRELFRNRSELFSAIQSGAVGEDYEIGPGDQIVLVLTGDVEQAYTLDVNRQGVIVVPNVGEVAAVGRTLAELEDALFPRLRARYSTLSQSPNGRTRFSVSLGRLRTISVFVAGEVEVPGRYAISSVGTLLEAMYVAGGPTGQGSLRRIRVERSGVSMGEFDLYPYLTAGTTGQDIRLQQGDFVFVPPAETLVTVTGAVRREAIFELTPGESVDDLVQFAGGLRPDAQIERASVDRILPPDARSPGMDRVVVDLPLRRALDGQTSFALMPGDRVQVFSVLPDVRATVRIDGAVWRQGTYELEPGMTLRQLIDQAGGTPPDVFPSRVLVSRLDPVTGRRSAIRRSLADAAGLRLLEYDEVTLFGIEALLEPDSVGIYGVVQNPGRYPLREGMTAEDLILLAGGFRRGAIPWEAAIAQPTRATDPTNTLAQVVPVSLSRDLPYPDSTIIWPLVRDVPERAASSVPLRPDWEVYVRRIPGFRTAERVDVEGEVAAPGTYALENVEERLSAILQRAGGPTGRAHLAGGRVVRRGLPVGADIERALRNPGSNDDPILEAGDRVVIPRYDPTVRIEGAVQFETLVQYRPGMSLNDVIEEAGGYRADADEGRVAVTYANGARQVKKKSLWIFTDSPAIRPGSTVSVPIKPEEDRGTDWDSILTRTLTVLSTFATVYIAVNN